MDYYLFILSSSFLMSFLMMIYAHSFLFSFFKIALYHVWYSDPYFAGSIDSLVLMIIFFYISKKTNTWTISTYYKIILSLYYCKKQCKMYQTYILNAMYFLAYNVIYICILFFLWEFFFSKKKKLTFTNFSSFVHR